MNRDERLTLADDLVERCQELLDWARTGLLNDGKGGAVHALADRLQEKVGKTYALRLAESQTKDEAMREVVRLAAIRQSSELNHYEDTVAGRIDWKMEAERTRLALADKIKYAIDTEGKITLYASHGRMVEAALRQSSERDAVVEGVQLIDGDEEDFTVGVERITLPRPKPLASKAGSEANSPPKCSERDAVVERERVTHKKRGTVYDVVGPALAQCDRPIVDMDELVVYQDPFSGQLWVRPKSEMEDGRFARALKGAKP